MSTPTLLDFFTGSFTASVNNLRNNLQDDPFHLVPNSLRNLLAYPAYKLGLQDCPTHFGPDKMIQTAVQATLAAVVLFKVIPAYTGTWTLALSAGLLVSAPTTALVGGALLFKVSYTALTTAYTLGKVSLLAEGILTGVAGYCAIHYFERFTQNFPSLLERFVMHPLSQFCMYTRTRNPSE